MESNKMESNKMESYSLVFSGLRALWGVVTPNVRKVSIYLKGVVITICFYYDKDPSELEIDLSEDAATEVIADFNEPFLIACERHTVSFPKKIEQSGRLIYSRYEDWSDIPL